MHRQDWLTACVVAVGVAMVTVALMAPPSCWAEQAKLVAVPALPSTQLTIPSINAQVTAAATPAPGQPVKVALTLKSPSGSGLQQVPVTITVLGTNISIMSRSMPKAEQVAQVTASVPVNWDGSGTALVDLPLTWAAPPPPQAIAPVKQEATADSKDAKPKLELQQVISYQMALSSTLGGQAAPTALQIITNTGNSKLVFPAPASPKVAPTAASSVITPVPVQPIGGQTITMVTTNNLTIVSYLPVQPLAAFTDSLVTSPLLVNVLSKMPITQTAIRPLPIRTFAATKAGIRQAKP